MGKAMMGKAMMGDGYGEGDGGWEGDGERVDDDGRWREFIRGV